MSVKRILLTGGSGFLGQAILRELDRSQIERVRVFDLEPVGDAARPGIESIQADICDYPALLAACAGVDLVVHSASLVDWGHASPERLTEVNVGGTENVVRACREAAVAGLVYTSSMDVVCGIEPVVAADETVPYPDVFTNEYSRTKALAEQVVLGAHGDGLATCVLRPCGMYGEADPYHVENFLAVLESGGLPFRVGDGSAAFQHVYVGNVAHAHVLAIQQLLEPGSRLAGQTYFVTDDSPASNFFDFMDPIVSGLGHRLPPKTRYVPFRLMLGLGALLEGAAALLRPIHHFTPTLTRSSVRFVCHDHTFVGDKFRRDAGYTPVYKEAEAIERTVRWFLASGRGV